MALTSQSSKTNCLHSRGRKNRRIAGGLFCLLSIIGLSLAIFASCFHRPFIPPKNSADWQTGDIFFSSGNSWRSLVVKIFDGKNPEGLTHCGFVIVDNGRPYLIHMSTEKNSIAKESIDEYARVNNVSKIIVRRLINPIDTSILRQRMIELITNRKEFDNAFDLRDSTQYYCTEFIVREFGRLGRDDFDDLLNKDYIYPVDLANQPIFLNILKND